MTLQMKNPIYCSTVLLTFFLLSCQSGGLETTNGFVTAYCSDGVVSGYGKPETRLTLCEKSFTVQDTGEQTIEHCIVDESGEYSFSRVPTGTYNLLCWDDDENKSIYIPGIQTQTDGMLFQDTLWLTPSITVFGTAYIGNSEKDSIIVSLIGTPLSAITSNESLYIVENVPAGNYSLYASYGLERRGKKLFFEANQEISVSSGNLNVPELKLTPKP
jgi:hypothetical protein